MKNNRKRYISIVMLVVMLFTLLPSNLVVTANSLMLDDSVADISDIETQSLEAIQNPINTTYTFHFYYYNQDTMLNKTEPDIYQSDLYIFDTTPGVVNNTSLTFQDKLIDTDNGITWVKGTIVLPYSNLGIIGRNVAGDWSGGQDTTDRLYNLTSGNEVTLWYLHGTGIYTEKPTVSIAEERYVIVEYIRPDGDYAGWNLYTWNSGFGGNVEIPFTMSADGRYLAKVPVKPTVSTLMFCVERNNWAEKDGGDHSIVLPLNQTVVKSKMYANSEPVLEYPYNIGYETEIDNNQVCFYYRDDKAYLDDTLETLTGKTYLIYNNTKYLMDYDHTNQRFYKNLPLENGIHTYYYEVDNQIILDKYNETNNGTESIFEYHIYTASIRANINTTSLSYNQNAVLSVQLDGLDANTIKVQEAYADLTSLGGNPQTSIDPELMQLTLAVRDNISIGTKNIPVTVIDQYGNKYTTNTSVDITSRDKTRDFDWDEAIIYFMVTDRFKDGNSSNNEANGTHTYGNNPGLYHGGDFAGVTSKLDYLKDLGINTIWITPIVENIDGVTVSGNGSADVPYNAGYHGYWTKNFEALNPSLGTEAELRTLIQEAHNRGIKIMVDIVINHAGYGTETEFQNLLRSPADCVAADEILQQLAGLPDFATERKEVRDTMVDWQTAWMKGFDIDFFRVDTVKHVDKTTWSYFKNELTKANPEFKLIGEYYGAGYANNFNYLNSGTMDSLLDFDFNDKASDFVKGNLDSVEAFLETRNGVLTNTATFGNFLSSHDEDGLLYSLKQTFDEETAKAKMMVAAALQITAKGQPVIYYGEEIGQSGANDYPYQTNRYDFDWTEANDQNKMLSHYKKLLSFRNENSSIFAKGDRTKLAGSDSEQFLVFDRTYNNNKVVVGLNISDVPKEVTLSIPKYSNRTVIDQYTGKIYNADQDGNITITIPNANAGGCVLLEIEKISTDNSGSNPSQNEITDTDSQQTTQTENTIDDITIGAVVDNKGTITINGSLKTTITTEKASIDIILTSEEIRELVKEATKENPLEITIPIDMAQIVDQLYNKSANTIELNLIANSELLGSDNINTEFILSRAILNAVKNNKKSMEVQIKDTDGATLYSWYFDGERVPYTSQKLDAINFTIGLGDVEKDTALSNLFKLDKEITSAYLLSMNDDNTLPTGTKVKVNIADKLGIPSGQKVYLYYYDQSTGKIMSLPKVTQKVGADGTITFNVIYSGEYVITTKMPNSKVRTSLLKQVSIPEKITVTLNSSKTIKPTITAGLNLVDSLSDELIGAGTEFMPVLIQYSTTDKKVLTVNKKTGKITGKKKGKAEIITTVTLKNGSKRQIKSTVTIKN